MSTSTRILELLGLLQSRRHWSGRELAHRLDVSPRTLRRDVDDLQDLGYPITTTRGTGGGYQLAPGASLPPLIIDEEEAAAIVLGLKEIASGAYPTAGEAAISVMAKIVQVLPSRIRRRVDSLHLITAIPHQAASPATIADVGALTTIALACRDTETLEFTYRTRTGDVALRTVHPHRIVSFEQRLYLVAYDTGRGAWRTFRIDRTDGPHRTGQRFAPRSLPGDDPVEFVRTQIGSMPSQYRVHATVQAPADRIRAEIAHYGTVEPLDEESCQLHLAADSLDWAAFCLAAIGAPFTLHGPPEAVHYVRRWGERLIEATGGRGP